MEIDVVKVYKLVQEQEDVLRSRTKGSEDTYARAKKTLVGGVASGYHSRVPYPLYISHGSGASIWDVDNNKYVDLHLCFGALAAGHTNPHIMQAIIQSTTKGILVGAPTEDNIRVSSLLSQHFDPSLSHWRFTNSGTEATRDAIQIARGITGYSHIIKIECGWHGQHESVCVSYHPMLEEAGPLTSPISVPSHVGIPKEMTSLTLVIPFNCSKKILLDKIESVKGKVACLIMEPILMNCGIILPEPEFLQMVREVCSSYKILLIFDEVKTNVTVGRGGATKKYGIVPDIITVGKSVGGGVSVGAVGMREEIAGNVAEGNPPTCGTFNGNPLTMAATLAMLEKVMNDESYENAFKLNTFLRTELESIIAEYKLPAQVTTAGLKGCVSFTKKKITDYRVYRNDCCHELAELMWYYLINNGVWMTPGGEEEWTISTQHTMEDIKIVLDAFKKFASISHTFLK